MGHTFLLQEGIWIAQGCYFDDIDRALPLIGMSRITHSEGLWINEGEMEIKAGDTPIRFSNRYEIVPFEEGQNHTTWEAVNPDMGTLLGRLIIVDDAIISTCRSRSDEYTGTEFFIKMSGTHYKNRGVLLKGDNKLSSWSVDLHKES